jgi:hypothetical protein
MPRGMYDMNPLLAEAENIYQQDMDKCSRVLDGWMLEICCKKARDKAFRHIIDNIECVFIHLTVKALLNIEEGRIPDECDGLTKKMKWIKGQLQKETYMVKL